MTAVVGSLDSLYDRSFSRAKPTHGYRRSFLGTTSATSQSIATDISSTFASIGDYFVSADSFGTFDLSEESIASGKTKYFLELLDADISTKLIRLQEAFWEDYERTLSSESLAAFRNFYSTLQDPVLPTFSAESTGLIVATWRKGRQYASLKFLNRDQFHYALALETPKGLLRPWGTSDSRSFYAMQPLAQAIIEQS